MTRFSRRRCRIRFWAMIWLPAAVCAGALHVTDAVGEPTEGEAGTSAASPGSGFTRLGTIRRRHAREIESSNWSVGAETMDRDYTIYKHWKQYLGPLGVKKARIQSGWAKTEKEKGKYDWAWLDEIILDMVDQGVEPWVCLCYGNPVYPDGGGTGLGGGLPQSEQALEAWDRFVAAIVRRYRQHVDHWEVWNEPGLRGANPEDAYAGLLIRTAEAVRREQTEGRVIAFAMAGIKLNWVESVLDRVQAAGKLHLIDEVSYHPYSYNPDDSYAGVQKLRALVRSYSDRITLRQGENGAPSKPGSYGALSKYEWTEARQAKWALRRLLGDLGRDIPSSYFAICDMQYPSRTNYKGLLAINDDKTVHHVKMGYGAIQNLTALFDDSVQRVSDFQAEVSGGEKDHYAVFGYRAAGDAPLVTLWRRSDPPGKQPEMERVALTIKDTAFAHPVWVDLLTGGVYEMDHGLWDVRGHDTVIPRLPVYDSPVVIAERRWIVDRIEAGKCTNNSTARPVQPVARSPLGTMRRSTRPKSPCTAIANSAAGTAPWRISGTSSKRMPVRIGCP